MPTPIARFSLTRYLKNTFGVRGSYSPELDETIVPTVDIAADDPVADDLTGYWTWVVLQSAVVGEFPFTGITPLQGRTFIRGIVLNAQPSEHTIRIALQAAGAASLYGFAAVQIGAQARGTVGGPGIRQGSQAADPISGNTIYRIHGTSGNIVSPFIPLHVGLDQGIEILITSDQVNVGRELTIVGRHYPNFPE